MTKIQKLINIKHNKFAEIAESCTTKAELHRALDIPYNGTYVRVVNKLIDDIGCLLKPTTPKYKTIKKTCPVCQTIFEDYENHPKSKTTCSHSCANTHFRTGSNHGNYNPNNYRNMCFEHHTKECVVCGENRIVEVHHYDENHDNTIPSNLIPLCPTHHALYHSRFCDDVKPIIDEYYNQKWSEMRESNPRLHRPKRCTLAKLS